MNRYAPSVFVGALLAATASAQVTHTVDVGDAVGGFVYSPADIVINVGDTVDWVWVSGFHDVESGNGGAPDGIFDSGDPELPPATFSVTFDQAFLDANPVPGNVYNYYCSIHVSFLMFGSVTVNIPPSVTSYGCQNPAGSLIDLAGAPTLGNNWTVGVDNPVPGGQPGGSLAFLSVSVLPAPFFPCGLPLPGFNMDPLQPTGELLINLNPPDPVLPLGPLPWAGTGTPTQFLLPIPPNPALLGLDLHTQGLIFDPTFANTFGASEGFKFKIGS